MRIGIPVNNGVLNSHFGQSTRFWVCDIAGEPPAITPHGEVAIPSGGGCGAIPMALSQAGVELVIAGGMGAGAMQNLKRAGIEVVMGVAGGTPEQIAHDYLSGKLAATQASCQQHGHGHGHHRHGHGHHQGQGGCCQASGSQR